MKTLITLITFCLFHSAAVATHLYGGYITTKKISGRKYEIRVLVVSDPNSPASQFLTNIDIDYGDGVLETVQRLSQGNLEGPFRTNTYVTTHEYQSDGIFVVTYTDPSLVDGIFNVNYGESGNTKLVLEAMIRISPTILSKENPAPLAYTFPYAGYGKPFSYNPTFIDMEGDNISYELLSNPDLPNYQLPATMSMNPYSGMITWNNLNHQGLFLIQYKVNSFDKGQLVAYSIVTQVIRVKDIVSDFPTPPSVPNTDIAPAGWYRSVVATPGPVLQPFILPFSRNSNFTDCNIKVFSELLQSSNGSVELKQNDSQQLANFSWSALTNMIRTTPYFVTFRLQSKTDAQQIKDYDLAFYHGAPLTTYNNEILIGDNNVSVYPNPSTTGNSFFILPPYSCNSVLRIFDMAGKEIVHTLLTQSSYNWEHPHQPAGLYLYSVELTNGSILKGKVVVE